MNKQPTTLVSSVRHLCYTLLTLNIITHEMYVEAYTRSWSSKLRKRVDFVIANKTLDAIAKDLDMRK